MARLALHPDSSPQQASHHVGSVFRKRKSITAQTEIKMVWSRTCGPAQEAWWQAEPCILVAALSKRARCMRLQHGLLQGA